MHQNRTIIFGGSFDPIHLGHLIMVQSVAEKVQSSKIMLIPTCANPLKNPPIATNRQRLEMLELAVQGDEKFEICDIELNRKPPSYSYNTIVELESAFDSKPALIVGADMIIDLHRWYRVDDLLDICDLIIACRPPADIATMKKMLSEKSGQLKLAHIEQISNSIIQTPMIDISSTLIRDRVKQGLSIDFLVPSKVAEYIKTQQIYK